MHSACTATIINLYSLLVRIADNTIYEIYDVLANNITHDCASDIAKKCNKKTNHNILLLWYV